jgi:hypothetical protein
VLRANLLETGGIFTCGQFQCLCIIVTIFDPNASNWSQCWLTHVSSQHAQEVSKIIAKITDANYQNAHVAIAGKPAGLNVMNTIKDAFLGTPVPNRPGQLAPLQVPFNPNQKKPESILIYAGGSAAAGFGFGINKAGRVGEMV